jgi:hypothetical protein
VFSDEIGGRLPHWHDTWLRTVLKAHGVKPTWSARLKYRGHSAETKAAYHRINLRWHDLRHEYASRLVERGVPLAQVRDLLGHASITTTERYDTQKLENLQVAATKLERGLTFSADAASWTPVPELTSAAGRNTDARPRVAPGRMPGTHEPREDRAGRRPISGGRGGVGADPVTGPAVVSAGTPGAPLRGDNLSSFFQELGSDAPIEGSDEARAIEANELSELNLGVWLGGRDSNPDNVVQSAVIGRACAPVCAFSLRF